MRGLCGFGLRTSVFCSWSVIWVHERDFKNNVQKFLFQFPPNSFEYCNVFRLTDYLIFRVREVLKLDIIEFKRTQNFLTYNHYLCCLHLGPKMESNHFLANIFHNFWLQLAKQQCMDWLNLILGDETLSSISVYRRWIQYWFGWTSIIRYCINIWLSKKFDRVGYYTI